MDDGKKEEEVEVEVTSLVGQCLCHGEIGPSPGIGNPFVSTYTARSAHGGLESDECQSTGELVVEGCHI